MAMSVISPKQLRDRIEAGDQVQLTDVRTPAEFREVHATIARNTPLESLDCGVVLAAHPGNIPLYVICRTGSRARQACEKLTAAGCTSVVNVEGGTMAWDQAGYPVVRGKKAIALERQVRICAGLSAFVGAGLMFAGEARIVKVNVDKEPELVTRYQFRSIPALVFIDYGKIVAQSAGAASEVALRRALNQIMGAAA